MKKLLSLLILAVMFVFPVLAFAAGSYTVTSTSVAGQDVRQVKISWVADASDGSIPSMVVPVNGYLYRVVTDPGSTAPTDLYDIAITDAHGLHVNSSTAFNDRSTSATQEVVLKNASSTDFYDPPYIFGSVTIAHTNNSVNSATGDLYLYIRQDK